MEAAAAVPEGGGWDILAKRELEAGTAGTVAAVALG